MIDEPEGAVAYLVRQDLPSFASDHPWKKTGQAGNVVGKEVHRG
jgi:hypothetical protein